MEPLARSMEISLKASTVIPAYLQNMFQCSQTRILISSAKFYLQIKYSLRHKKQIQNHHELLLLKTESRFLGQSVLYNLETRSFWCFEWVSIESRTQQLQWHIEHDSHKHQVGESSKLSTGNYHALIGKFTAVEQKQPHWATLADMISEPGKPQAWELRFIKICS